MKCGFRCRLTCFSGKRAAFVKGNPDDGEIFKNGTGTDTMKFSENAKGSDLCA